MFWRNCENGNGSQDTLNRSVLNNCLKNLTPTKHAALKHGISIFSLLKTLLASLILWACLKNVYQQEKWRGTNGCITFSWYHLQNLSLKGKVCVKERESTESNSTRKAEMPSSKHELRVCVYLLFFFFLSVWNVTHRTTSRRTAANWMCLIESTNTKNSRRGLRDESTWSTTVEDRPKIY